VSATSDACWRRIGVFGGDHSCPTLATALHCRNCPVHAEAALGLFERESPPEDEAADLRATRRQVGQAALLLFRIATQWFALPPAILVEIAEARPATRIAHRTRGHVAGVVNVRGELHLEVALAALLGLAPAAAGSASRLLLLRDAQGAVTACRVDEVRGIVHADPGRIVAVPGNLAPLLQALLRGYVDADGMQAGVVDPTALARALQEALYA
jgi:chemotaxis signal transduction protein